MSEHVALADLGPGRWWYAHDFPERPADDWTVWDWACDSCFIHLVLAARTDPDRIADSTLDPGTPEEDFVQVSMRECLERAVAWRAEHGFRPIPC